METEAAGTVLQDAVGRVKWHAAEDIRTGEDHPGGFLGVVIPAGRAHLSHQGARPRSNILHQSLEGRWDAGLGGASPPTKSGQRLPVPVPHLVILHKLHTFFSELSAAACMSTPNGRSGSAWKLPTSWRARRRCSASVSISTRVCWRFVMPSSIE